MWFYRTEMCPKDAVRMASNVNPNQTALAGAVWSGTTLFSQTCLSKIWATSWQNQQNGMCAQRRLRSAWASAQSDQSSLSAWRKLGSLTTHWAHSEDSDQPERIFRLIRVFAGRTCHFVGFVMRRLNYLGSLRCLKWICLDSLNNWFV